MMTNRQFVRDVVTSRTKRYGMSPRCTVQNADAKSSIYPFTFANFHPFRRSRIHSGVCRTQCCIIRFDDNLAGLVVLIDLTKTTDTDTIDKLRFILNRRITCLHADAIAIIRAIERDYGVGD